jgi:leucyl/phenylalanyl-tRNA--protein transferase
VTIYRLGTRPVFPDPERADPSGLLAVGGELEPAWLVAAYASGVFPWYEEGYPRLWWSPDPRVVLELDGLKVSRSLGKTMRRGHFQVRFDTSFRAVMERCATIRRRHEQGTWIVPELVDAYVELHRLGFAHSVETWEGGELVGGLYGVSLGGAFFGESMFAARSDASKVALARLTELLRAWGFDFIDCQLETEHLRRLGAHPIPRRDYLARLERTLARPTRRGPWTEPAGATDADGGRAD